MTSNRFVLTALQLLILVASISLITKEVRFQIQTRCKFSPAEEGALPVILFSMGRSGSSVTWDTISRLMGEPTTAWEVTGQTKERSQVFFNSIDDRVGSKWATQRLCHIQKKNPKDAGIIGFQWKPYKKAFNHKYAIGALKDIGDYTNVPIRAIYLTRNVLDRKLSNLRHTAHDMTVNDKLSAHCAVGDEDCIKKHAKSLGETDLYLPTGQELIDKLREEERDEENIQSRLAIFGIPYIKVSYEKLYHSDDAEEWMRLFKFLGRGPAENLSMDDVREHFSIASTTNKKRSETFSNFDEVEKSLKGTRYESLLYN